MSADIHDILSRYWGYDSFRPLQEDIIRSVLDRRDTLGLLPTGGGKSITFQVPAMALDGVTIVVTPLISLMKDQVDNLRSRGVKAVYLHAGLSRAENRLALDRCRYGKVKLLYVSPEKLQSRRFIDELRDIPVSLIVVDEAHCISQWGYDFRPSYLRIADLRSLAPDAPVLALTASATPEVVNDIMDSLGFKSRNLFARSFARDNISYIVRNGDDKERQLLRVLRGTSGSAIVYVRSRRRTRETAQWLLSEGISADFYHAGLSPEDKEERQNRWKSGETRVIVATNAFGMGIDKPDVRAVVHLDTPSSLEEYYQEAGRAGRDGLPAYAVLLASSVDKGRLTRSIDERFPDKDYCRRVYELAGNFTGVPVGSGYNEVYEFNFPLFCKRFDLRPVPADSALRLLTRAGYIDYVEELNTGSRVIILLAKHELYSLTLQPVVDKVFQTILRTYTGLFSDYVYINETLIARQAELTEQTVYDSLLTLSRLHALHYVPRKSTPYLCYTTARELPRYLTFPRAVYEDMRRRLQLRVEAMKRFAFDSSACRVNTMLRYFGETPTTPCGKCDVCRSRRPNTPHPQSPNTTPANTTSSTAINPTTSTNTANTVPTEGIASPIPTLRESLTYMLSHSPRPISYLIDNAPAPESDVIDTLRSMLDDHTVTTDGLLFTLLHP
ncbi:MAG: RecQ family ATP-dependent DNA helicase [Pseudoflavonifractor sp.]|nr:RecQ family ATP-dependent DNA helicase [Pseudoflavonifractor sp.]